MVRNNHVFKLLKRNIHSHHHHQHHLIIIVIIIITTINTFIIITEPLLQPESQTSKVKQKLTEERKKKGNKDNEIKQNRHVKFSPKKYIEAECKIRKGWKEIMIRNHKKKEK